MRARDFVFAPSGALRAPWRIAIFVLIAVVGHLILLGSVQTLWPALLAGSGYSLTQIYIVGAAGVVALSIAHAICLRWVDGGSWESVGLDRRAARPRVLAGGFAIGALALALPAAVLLALGWLDVREAAEGSSMRIAVLALVAFAPAAMLEELALRGYVFSVLRETWGWRPALVVLSVLFGLAHVANPGATAQAIAIVSLAGVFLGMVLLATGSLYAAWTAHLAWNWTLVAVLHTEVSGIPVPVADYRVVDAGPDWATGGSWGPEGGAAAGIGMLLGIGFLIARRRRRGEL